MIDSIVCPWEFPHYLLFSSNVPFLLPYSHFVSLTAAILTALFLYKSSNKLFGKIFSVLAMIFSLWVIIDWHVWATNQSNVVMFLWAVQILIEIIVYLTALYLTYTFIYKKTPPTKIKMIGSLFALPVIFLLPTRFILQGIDIAYCDAVEHVFIKYYSYGIEALIIIIILHILWVSLRSNTEVAMSEKILFGIGIITFLLAFTSGNIIGSITENWEYAQFGLFGMPLFMGIVAFSIMKYNAFKTKTLGAQILVAILILLTSAILFIRTIERVRVITSVTLVLVIILGYILVRSVRREVQQREKIEKLAEDLSKANDRLTELDKMKSEFLSLATHQIRSPLTAIKGYSSMVLEGDFGEISQTVRQPVKTIMTSCQNLIDIVNEFLDISRIEQGRMAYNKEIFDISDLTKEVAHSLRPNVEKAGLILNTNLSNQRLSVNADKGKIRQIIGNLIDNAIKYTPKGSIEVSTLLDHDTAEVMVKDTGIGIDPHEVNKLFTKFSRTKDAHKTNVTGTGLGLYIAKKMAEAHGGDIVVQSEGAGKGATFILKLPISRI